MQDSDSYEHPMGYRAPQDLIDMIDKLLADEGLPEILYFGTNRHSVYKKCFPDGLAVRLSLEPSLKLADHSSHFSWGYCGSGPTQLAIALLLDATGNPQTAQDYAYDFTLGMIAQWPKDGHWSIYRSEILGWISQIKNEYLLNRISKN